jgi:hypothetical protein
LFVENYIPMFNADKSKVIAMVEIYKEPVDLVARIQRGFKAIWLATLLVARPFTWGCSGSCGGRPCCCRVSRNN